MKPVAKLLILALVPLMTSACCRQEIPRSVSDYCLNDREVKFSIAPGPGDDAENAYDTDETINDLIAHNAALRKVCGNK